MVYLGTSTIGYLDYESVKSWTSKLSGISNSLASAHPADSASSETGDSHILFSVLSALRKHPRASSRARPDQFLIIAERSHADRPCYTQHRYK